MNGRERFLADAAECGIALSDVRTFPEGTRTARDAAAAIGCPIHAIVKSLVFMADDQPIMALVNGAARVDEERLRHLAGAAHLRMATADEVRDHTGYAIGGTPPVAGVGSLPRWIDRVLLGLVEVWGAAGTTMDVFPVAPGDLVTATGAEVADITA